MSRFARAFAVVVLAAAAGCGGPSGVAVSGTVTRGGTPLSAGTVAFEPKAGTGTTGPGAWGAVRDGAFTIPAASNLIPGTYVVRVSPPTLNSGDNLKTAPPQFKAWETTVELKPDAPPFKFELPAKD